MISSQLDDLLTFDESGLFRERSKLRTAYVRRVKGIARNDAIDVIEGNSGGEHDKEFQYYDLHCFCFIPCVGPLCNESAPLMKASIVSRSDPVLGFRMMGASRFLILPMPLQC